MSNTQQSTNQEMTNFRYQIKFDDSIVAEFTQVENVDSAPIKIQNSAEGQMTYQPIQFKRGTSDNLSFVEWCQDIWDIGKVKSKEIDSLSIDRRNLTLLVMNEAGQTIGKYSILKSWVSQSELFTLKESPFQVMIENLEIQNTGILKIK